MSTNSSIDQDFLDRLTAVIEDHVSDQQFGVSELAGEMGMSRSNLLRKIKKNTHLSASQFIRQVRLQHSMELLKSSSLTVSEVAFRAGFSSTSYYIKCFREYYGYPPGEAGKRREEPSEAGADDHTRKNHQLAAIMFTDIQGYTALMQQDEAKAVAYRNRHREVFNAAIKKYNGRILQYYGDGTLSTFSSAIDAVRCGIEMQQAFQDDPQIPVRIGIHTGDIIFTEDDIIGDGVNVASRIESLAAVGSVFISEKVYDEVKNQSDILTASMGVFELKNVSKPMEVFAIANKGLVVPEEIHAEGKVKQKHQPEKQFGRPVLAGRGLIWLVGLVAVILVIYLVSISDLLNKEEVTSDPTAMDVTGQSIAVLPFINDSYDSSNVYIINGLMESILNNLQKIKGLRVVSRTSVEKYRNSIKSAREIADELDVQYLIEGSGQKIGDQIKLSIQLIEGTGDRHLWSEQYNRNTKDIFSLQSEVAKNIAREIQVFVSPEEEERIEQPPTNNLVAYDHFLHGIDLLYNEDLESFRKAITWFQKAVKHDSTFARAYADIGLAYYYLDMFRAEKLYSDTINYYADQALNNDPDLSQSLLAKGLYYMNTREYDMALPYLEKALEFQPNSALIIHFLSEYYTNYRPDTEKYLEYALKGAQLNVGADDSTTTSYSLLHLGNALVQSGFVDEAEDYIDRSLQLNPENIYSQYVKVYIQLSRDLDFEKARDGLLNVLAMDTTRLDVLQEIGKIYYFMRDYEGAYPYYRKFVDIRKAQQMDIFPFENAKIGLVFDAQGLHEEARDLFSSYRSYAEKDLSIYKNLSLAAYHSYMDNKEQALENMQLFSEQDNYYYWVVLFLGVDPLMDNIQDDPAFETAYKVIQEKFQRKHQQIRQRLEAEGLI